MISSTIIAKPPQKTATAAAALRTRKVYGGRIGESIRMQDRNLQYRSAQTISFGLDRNGFGEWNCHGKLRRFDIIRPVSRQAMQPMPKLIPIHGLDDVGADAQRVGAHDILRQCGRGED